MPKSKPEFTLPSAEVIAEEMHLLSGVTDKAQRDAVLTAVKDGCQVIYGEKTPAAGDYKVTGLTYYGWQGKDEKGNLIGRFRPALKLDSNVPINLSWFNRDVEIYSPNVEDPEHPKAEGTLPKAEFTDAFRKMCVGVFATSGTWMDHANLFLKQKQIQELIDKTISIERIDNYVGRSKMQVKLLKISVKK